MNYKLQCGRFTLDLERPKIMGIVNVTPDSFSDGGHYNQHLSAIEHAYQLLEQGADILDIGGESSRPGSDPVSMDDELARVVPIVKELVQAQVPLSIDTFKPEVMQACLDLGVDLVNDIYALRQPGAMEVLASFPQATVCIMHMYGHPKTMQLNPPDYGSDVSLAICQFLQDRIKQIQDHGIDKSRIIVDPGFGFGKTTVSLHI